MKVGEAGAWGGQQGKVANDGPCICQLVSPACCLFNLEWIIRAMTANTCSLGWLGAGQPL